MKRKKSLLIAKQNEALPLSFLTKAREKKMTKKIKFIFVKSEEINTAGQMFFRGGFIGMV